MNSKLTDASILFQRYNECVCHFIQEWVNILHAQNINGKGEGESLVYIIIDLMWWIYTFLGYAYGKYV